MNIRLSAIPSPTQKRLASTDPLDALPGPWRAWLAALWLSVSLAILVMLGLGVAATPLTLTETALYHTEPIGEIYAAQTVGQTFTAPYDGLNSISVSLADYGRRNIGPVVFRLKAAPDSPQALVEQSFPAASIRGDTMQTLSFMPIPASAGRLFYFELAAPEAAPGNAVTAYVRPHDPYAEGTAYWRGAPAAGDLVFVAGFQPGFVGRAQAMLGQITAGKPWPWDQAWFYGVLGGLMLLAVVWTARGIASRGVAAAGGTAVHTRTQWAQRLDDWGWPALLLVVFLRSLFFSAVIPPWAGPDELGHFEYVALVHALGRIPASLPDTEIIPELTREINASAAAQGLERRSDLLGRIGIRSLSEREPPALAGPREAGYQRPFYYQILAPVYTLVADRPVLVRYFVLAAVSGALATLTVGLSAAAAQALFPGDRFVVILAALLVAFWPTQAYMASRINNDNLAAATAAFSFWIVIITVRQGLSLRSAMGLAAGMALALLVKGSTVFLVPLLLGAAALGGLRRWRGAMPVAYHCWLAGGLGLAALCGGMVLAAAILWPEAARALSDLASRILWPSRSREWIIGALNVLAATPVLDAERLVVNSAEAFRLAALFWYPHGWRVFVPTEWVFRAGPVFAVGLWILGVAAVGWGHSLRRLTAGYTRVDVWQGWGLALLALAFLLATTPLLTRMVIDPFLHWWHGRILMTLLAPASVWLALGWRWLTPQALQPVALSAVLAVLVLGEAYNLGMIILPVFYR